MIILENIIYEVTIEQKMNSSRYYGEKIKAVFNDLEEATAFMKTVVNHCENTTATLTISNHEGDSDNE